MSFGTKVVYTHAYTHAYMPLTRLCTCLHTCLHTSLYASNTALHMPTHVPTHIPRHISLHTPCPYTCLHTCLYTTLYAYITHFCTHANIPDCCQKVGRQVQGHRWTAQIHTRPDPPKVWCQKLPLTTKKYNHFLVSNNPNATSIDWIDSRRY